MSHFAVERNLRILIVDDNRAIHDDFRKILCPSSGKTGALAEAEAVLFDEEDKHVRPAFSVDSALQGQEAIELVTLEQAAGRPYAMAFVDVRMPPGLDGVETTAQLWKICPDLQVVLCTAYSDYSWDEMAARLSNSDQLLILKKPFDSMEVLQLANAMTEKWRLHQEVRLKLEHLEKQVEERTGNLRVANEKLQNEVLERQRVADALRESDERHQLLFRKNPLPMWVVDIETLEFLAVNETAVRQYGYSVEEFLGMTLRELRPADEVPSMLGQLARFRRDACHQVSARHRLKSGERIDVEIISRTIRFAGRDARLTLANNITERKSAEDRIRQQAMLLDLSPDAIFVRDLRGRIQYWNKGAEQLFGWTAVEAVGEDLSCLFPRNNPDSITTAERVLLANGEWRGELQRHTKAGAELTVDCRWTLLRDETGCPRSVLSINTDITERKRLEAQFLRAQRMEGIGTLATGMAHDLNNILAPILMSAGALRWDLNKEESETAISRIEMSVKRAADIIQQVLTFGRGVSGDRVSVNGVELMEEIARIIRETFPRDVEISVSTGVDVCPIVGDKTQLHQVLLNLCINSRDAMPEGGALKLSAHNFAVDASYAEEHPPLKPGPHVRIEVSDSGCGIPQSDLERIFDPFFTTKEFGKGTGLGLSTVLGIVKSHHGLVQVDSVMKAGTTFKILLPAAGAPAKTVGGVAPSAQMPRGKGESILIVDDEANIVSATRKMLEKNGYTVLVASSSEEALEIFAEQGDKVELVVTDIMMPGMDGVALVRELKRIAPGMRVLASSGFGRDPGGDAQRAQLDAMGVCGFLAKPYTAGKLLTAMREALGENGTQQEPVSGAASAM